MECIYIKSLFVGSRVCIMNGYISTIEFLLCVNTNANNGFDYFMPTNPEIVAITTPVSVPLSCAMIALPVSIISD